MSSSPTPMSPARSTANSFAQWRIWASRESFHNVLHENKIYLDDNTPVSFEVQSSPASSSFHCCMTA